MKLVQVAFKTRQRDLLNYRSRHLVQVALCESHFLPSTQKPEMQDYKFAAGVNKLKSIPKCPHYLKKNGHNDFHDCITYQ